MNTHSLPPSLPLSHSHWILHCDVTQYALYTLHWVTSTHFTSAEWNNICKQELQPTPSSESARPWVLIKTVTLWSDKQQSSSRELQCPREAVYHQDRTTRRVTKRTSSCNRAGQYVVNWDTPINNLIYHCFFLNVDLNNLVIWIYRSIYRFCM